MQLNVVTHSAGDADFDTAAVKGYVKDITIPNRIAIGPVFDGTVMGNIGNRFFSSLFFLWFKFPFQSVVKVRKAGKTAWIGGCTRAGRGIRHDQATARSATCPQQGHLPWNKPS